MGFRRESRELAVQMLYALDANPSSGLMDTLTREDVNKWATEILQAKNCRAAAIVPKAFVGVF